MKKRSFSYIVIILLLVLLLFFIGEELNVKDLQKQTSSITGHVVGEDECGDITSSGSYTLTQSVSSIGTCFSIEADNIILDCDGYTITYSTEGGSDTRGIDIYGRDNITIKNCRVEDGSLNQDGSANRHGIYLGASDNSVLENNYVNANNGLGILLSNSDNNNLIDNTVISKRAYGIWITSSSSKNVLIGNNGTSFNGAGIKLSYESNHNVLINNTATGGGTRWSPSGIFIYANCTNNTLINNTATSNVNLGLFMYENVTNNLIIDNTITGNVNGVLRLSSNSLNNVFINNTFISGDGDDLILFIDFSSGNNTFYWNDFTQTTNYYVDNDDNTNQFNTTVGGEPRGNYYFNIESINITDSDNDGWGDGGSDYPLNTATWPTKWINFGVDYGPATTLKAEGGTPPVCGNGVIETGEGCDDGNTNSGDGCSATCQIEGGGGSIPGNETEAPLPFFDKIHFFITLIVIGIAYWLMLSKSHNKKRTLLKKK